MSSRRRRAILEALSADAIARAREGELVVVVSGRVARQLGLADDDAALLFNVARNRSTIETLASTCLPGRHRTDLRAAVASTRRGYATAIAIDDSGATVAFLPRRAAA